MAHIHGRIWTHRYLAIVALLVLARLWMAAQSSPGDRQPPDNKDNCKAKVLNDVFCSYIGFPVGLGLSADPGSSPLAFEPNLGQDSADYDFVSPQGSVTLLLNGSGPTVRMG